MAPQLRQSCHYQQHYHISDWFQMFLILSKVNHTWIIFPQSSWRYLPTKPVFERILTKAFWQYILNLMSKKKLGSFIDLINAYFQSFISLPRYEHFLTSIFCKVSLALLNRIQTTLKRLQENITKTWKPLIIDRSIRGANIGIHSNLRDCFFFNVFAVKNQFINEQERAVLEIYVNSVFYLHKK